MRLVEHLHDRYGHRRRARVLAHHFVELIPESARLLDVGCGDGLLAREIARLRPDLSIRGIEVQERSHSHIEVERFDGLHIPYPDDAFDLILFVDVLHHSDDALCLLREGARVARRAMVIKDHTLEGLLAQPTLRFMDDVGNARHGVTLPYNYWTREHWESVLSELSLPVESWTGKLGLYPWPASWLFDRSLHFIARLDTSSDGVSP